MWRNANSEKIIIYGAQKIGSLHALSQTSVVMTLRIMYYWQQFGFGLPNDIEDQKFFI